MRVLGVSLGCASAANDNFENAALVTGASVTIQATTFGATEQANEPSAGYQTQASVWYSWVAPAK